MMSVSEVRELKALLEEWGLEEQTAKEAAFNIAYGHRFSSILSHRLTEVKALPTLAQLFEGMN